MYKILDKNGLIFNEVNYASEDEFERVIVENAEKVFGSKGIYFNIKKKIGLPNQGTIPDGYFLDLTFHDAPQLYFVEIEMSNHNVFMHIGSQILKFAFSSDVTKHKIKKILIDEVKADSKKKEKLDKYFQNSKYRNLIEILDKVIYEQESSVIIVIDKEEDQLSKVLSKIKINTEIIEFQSYKCGNDVLHRFNHFQEDLLETEEAAETDAVDIDEFDTIIVPAKEDGFKEVFLGEDCWYQIRISISMLDKIKYIAAYQVAPTSAITHVAEVKSIEKYKDTNKYIVHFNGKAKEIKQIVLGTKQNGNTPMAPRSPRYASYNKLMKAKKFDEIWK